MRTAAHLVGPEASAGFVFAGLIYLIPFAIGLVTVVCAIGIGARARLPPFLLWALVAVPAVGLGCVHALILVDHLRAVAATHAGPSDHDSVTPGQITNMILVGSTFIAIPVILLWAILMTIPMLLVVYRRQRRIRRGHCPRCNYDREGIVQAAPCPECGTAPIAPT